MIRAGAPLRMFLALVVGLASGIAMSGLRLLGLDILLAIARPVGQLWLDALTMTVVPLVFGLLVIGIATAARTASASQVALRALLWFAILLTLACLFAAVAATALLAAWPVNVAVPMADPAIAAPQIAPPGDWFRNLIPNNPVKAAAETAMVPIVVFALLFGFAAARIERPLSEAITIFFRAIVQIMLVIVGWVLRVAPLGIAALAFVAGARMGVASVGTLFHYVVIVATICLAISVLCYPVAIFAGNLSFRRFARAVAPAQTVALSTQSSLASLPVMIEAAPALGVNPVSAGVVLPLAVSLFRAASVAANITVAIYLAQLHGLPLTWSILGTGILVAVPVSLAAVGLPAQVSFFATIGPVCIAMGVPLDTLPLLLAVETIPDLFRTLGNVTADLAVTRLTADCGDAANTARII